MGTIRVTLNKLISFFFFFFRLLVVIVFGLWGQAEYSHEDLKSQPTTTSSALNYA